MLSSHDSLRIHISLVSHTNIGKTTLARTLLAQDIGNVADRAHVTETNDQYILARDNLGCELILWDTPGFGHSVRLAKRLSEKSNPITSFLSEVWDRLVDKPFWLDQRLLRHIRDTSDILLYLVNVSEHPQRTPYIQAEMKILSWLNKPVIVLLNQMGVPDPEKENRDLAIWKEAMSRYACVHKVLPMDAFARCWIQEVELFNVIGQALPESHQATYASLERVWIRSRRATYSQSVRAISHHILRLLLNHKLIPAPSIKEQVLTFAKHFGLLKNKTEELEDAQTALSAFAADRFCSLTNELIRINQLRGHGVAKEILRRMKTDWNTTVHSIDLQRAGAMGAGVGAASGVAADLSVAGLSMGLGTLIGTVIGAIGGASAAKIYNAKHQKEGIEIDWSEEAMQNFLLEALLLYLAIAHFGRGRGDWVEGESPAHWKKACRKAIQEHKTQLTLLRKANEQQRAQQLQRHVDTLLRSIFFDLYRLTP